MTYTEMFDCLKARGFTLDFDPTADPVCKKSKSLCSF